jgi:hypothetical protein
MPSGNGDIGCPFNFIINSSSNRAKTRSIAWQRNGKNEGEITQANF